MIGRFHGGRHSHGRRDVDRFFDLPAEAGLIVVCGRNAEDAARKLGWSSRATDWQAVDRADIEPPSAAFDAAFSSGD